MIARIIDLTATDMRKREFLAYAEHMASYTRVWMDGDAQALMAELPEGASE